MEYFKAIGVNTLVANIVAKLSADIEIRLNEKEVTQVKLSFTVHPHISGISHYGHYYAFDQNFDVD